MKFPIGFRSQENPEKMPEIKRAEGQRGEVSPSMVLVRLPGCHIPLSYYNDRFELREGDIVFVEGKYEGVPGKVEKVTDKFHVDLEEYKRVLGVADTRVRGSFRQAGSHFITFAPEDLPYHQALSWHKAAEEEHHYIQYEEKGFALDTAAEWPFKGEVLRRGGDYYGQNKVVYLCLEGEEGKAIVQGGEAYEVFFRYEDGQISDLVCDCPCGFPCKHEAAALMQLKETLEIVEKQYQKEYESSGYFAVVSKSAFFTFAVDGSRNVVVKLG